MALKTFVKTFKDEDSLNDFIQTQEVDVIDVKPIIDENGNMVYVLIGKIKVYQ